MLVWILVLDKEKNQLKLSFLVNYLLGDNTDQNGGRYPILGV